MPVTPANEMMRALVLTATIVAAAPAAAAELEVATVRLTAFNCLPKDKQPVGTGFVVENWLGADRVLVTALHVVDQCATVKAQHPLTTL